MLRRVGRGQIRTDRLRRPDVAARRRQIRLHDEVVPRRTTRAVRRQRVVRPHRRAVRVDRPHRNRIRTVRRRRNPAHHGLAVLRPAVIPRRDDDHQPRARRALDGLAQRIVAIRLQHRRAHRQVDDPHVEVVAVRDRPVDRLDHVADVARPGVAQHPQVQQIRARRHAAVILRVDRRARLAGDDRRHVRAVAVVILAVAAGEILREQHAPALERGVLRVDPRIDHRHGDPLARLRPHIRRSRPHLIGADALQIGRGHRRLNPDVARQMILRVVAPHRVELTGVHQEHPAARHVLRDLQVVALRQAVNLRLRPVDNDADALGAGRQVIGQVGAEPRVVRTRGRRRGSAEHERGRGKRRGDQSREGTGRRAVNDVGDHAFFPAKDVCLRAG